MRPSEDRTAINGAALASVRWRATDFSAIIENAMRGEDVYRALGQTDAGRYLVVFFIHKLTREALILSARDMDHKERRSYGR